MADPEAVPEPHAGPPGEPSTDQPGTEGSVGTGATGGGGMPPGCPPPPDTSGCEPGVDELDCIAEGDAAKSAYHAEFKADLATAKTSYEDARKAYADARRTSAPIVADLQNQIKHILERIRCQIEQKRVWRCLDDAWCEVRKELACCPRPAGCCATPCEFPVDDIEGRGADALGLMIADYQKRIDAAKTCFHDLLGEATRLTTAVEAAKKAVADLLTDLSVDTNVDLKKVYAEALVWDWKIDAVWGGFTHVQSYVDCLCQALTCWTKGCSAVYVLKGAEAVAECKDRARQERCDKLWADPAAQVLVVYERLCPKPRCEDDEPDDQAGGGTDDDGDDDGCGCHHHHHHHEHQRSHRHHHCDCGCHDEDDADDDHGHHDHGHHDHGHHDHGCGCR